MHGILRNLIKEKVEKRNSVLNSRISSKEEKKKLEKKDSDLMERIEEENDNE